LSQIEQPLETFKKAEATKKLEAAIKPLRKSILKHYLIKHTDKEVKLLVAICVSEVFRVLAPEPPFEDKYLRVMRLFPCSYLCFSMLSQFLDALLYVHLCACE